MPRALQSRKSRKRSGAFSLQTLLNVLGRSADGVFAVDTDQRVIFWSAAADELVGPAAGEVLGRPCYEVVLGSDYDGHPFCRRDCPTIRAARRGRAVPDYDITCARKDGNVCLNVSIVPIPRRVAGGPVAVHMIRDVTHRRRSERLAQAAIETVNRFTAQPDGPGPERPRPVPGPSLTVREIEVLRRLADGHGTDAIARELGLSGTTIRNHVQRLLAKLGVHNRLEAVVYGARMGLI